MAFKNYDSSGNVLSRSLTDLPVGTIVSTALSAAPSGWLICDGTAVSRTNYPELFGALGTGYGAGNGTTTFNVPNSDGQMILAISTAQRIGVAMPPQFVTTLPSSPIDGTEVYYQSTAAGTGGGATATMAGVGAVWHLRYNAASSSTNKWEFVGGTTILAQNQGQQGSLTYTAGQYREYGTDLRITTPFAGDYRCEVNASLQVEYAGYTGIGVALGTAAVPAYVSVGYQAANTKRDNRAHTTVLPIAANTIACLKTYSENASGNGFLFEASISITPIRVSA